MTIINSSSNKQVQLLKKLAQKKYRAQLALFLAEGSRLVCDAIRLGANVVQVYQSQTAFEKQPFENAVVLADKIFDSISDTVNTQGVIATIKIEQKPFSKGNCLILDGVADPGNVGTLLRTASATGFLDVFLCNCADVYSSKVVRSAMSAHFLLNLHVVDLENAFSMVKGMDVYCADMGGEDVFDVKFEQPFALVLGNEANGVSQFSKDNSTKIVSLPMENQLESLNVSVAGGVLMYLSKNIRR